MQRRGFVFSCLSAVAGLFGARGKPETPMPADEMDVEQRFAFLADIQPWAHQAHRIYMEGGWTREEALLWALEQTQDHAAETMTRLEKCEHCRPVGEVCGFTRVRREDGALDFYERYRSFAEHGRRVEPWREAL